MRSIHVVMSFLFTMCFLFAACTPNAGQVAASSPTPQDNIAALPSATAEPTLTATPAPTETPVPTNTPPMPTSTNTPLPTATFGLAVVSAEVAPVSGWCSPETWAIPTVSGKAPAEVDLIKWEKDAVEISGLPSSSCTLLFTFSQPVAADSVKGMKFQVYGLKETIPWLETSLLPTEEVSNVAGVVLTHSYIIAPPFWDVSYTFVLKAADGTELLRADANLHRWKPELCWNGQLPDLNTLRCGTVQWGDIHPWDPSYGTPAPTE